MTPIRHHYVPEMLQKRFVDAQGWLHVHNRAKADGAIYKGRPAEIFHERHLYSEVSVDGIRDPAKELALSRLEHAADRVIEKIVTAARSDREIVLSSREREVWYEFLAIQWKRVPDLHLTVTTDEEANALFEDVIKRARAELPHLIQEIDALDTAEERARMIRNARLGALGTTPSIQSALRTRGLAIAKIRRPDKQFVLASQPVVRLTAPGQTDLRDPGCELWLPVARDVAIGLGRGAGRVDVFDVEPSQIRQVNLAAAAQSTILAGGSRALVASLGSPR